MGFEAALQRVEELQQMLGQTPAPSSSTASPSDSSAFAASLSLAQQQLVAGDGTASENDRSLSGLTQDPTLALQAQGFAGGTAGSGMGMSISPAGVGGSPYGVVGSYGGLVPAAGLGSAYPVSSQYGYGFPSGGSTGQRIVSIAQNEVGVAEAPAGSNDSPRIREYRSATAGALNTPGPWCSYFTSWVCRNAGVPIGPNGSGLGYVPSVESWGKQTGRWIDGSNTPQPGDLTIFERNGDGVADHIGIVESVDANGTIHTIEGNSSDRVSRRSYSAGSIHGFVRPS